MHQGFELNAFAYHPKRGAWLPAEPRSSHIDSLSVATYNVWFAHYEKERRWRGLLAEVRRADADVIAFQEVTIEFLDLVLAQPWVRSDYAISDIEGDTLDGYGVVLLSRLGIEALSLYPMRSRMGRKLLCAGLGGSLAVATIHLESLNSKELRGVQFDRCVQILSAYDHAVLMGDMNFCSSWPEEQARVPKSFTDVWPALHPDDPGYTEDTAVNATLLAKEGKAKRVRYDRVFLRSTAGSWQPESIERLGMRPVEGSADLFPSDHFGLSARLVRR